MQVEQPRQGYCIACYSENPISADRCHRCAYPAILHYPAPKGFEEAALLPVFARSSASDAWSEIQGKLLNRHLWLSPAAIESIQRFVSAEMDYSTATDRGLGRMTDYVPRLAAWKRGDIQRLSSSERDLLSGFITQLILAGYGTHISILAKPRSVQDVSVEQLYEKWIPRIYGIDYRGMLPEDLRPSISDVRNRLAGLFQYQYEKVLRLRVGMLGKVKFGTIALYYFDGGALLAHSEWELGTVDEAFNMRPEVGGNPQPAELPHSVVEAFQGDDEDAIQQAIERAVLLGLRAVSELARLMDAGDDPLSINAARALGSIGEAGTGYLIEGLRNSNPIVRQAAVIGLAWCHESKAQYYAPLIADADDDVRIATAMVLAQQGVSGLFYLTQALADPNAEVRFAATNGLLDLLSTLSNNLQSRDPDEVESVAEIVDTVHWDSMLDRLLQHESDPDFRVRTNATVLRRSAGLTAATLNLLRSQFVSD